MSDLRRLKSIGARYDVDVSSHPDPWKRLRSRLSWVFAIGTSIACLPWLMGNHQAFQSECVSDAHRVFGQDCQLCHDQPLAPVQRMVTFNNHWHSTSDHKCQKCHRETNSDHLLNPLSDNERQAKLEQELKPKFDQIGCAGCHTEHRGNSALAHVTDSNCTDCHINQQDKISPRKFDLNFADFRHHQEFAIWRKESGQQPDREHHSGKGPKIEWEKDQPRDRTLLKFSHHRHLDPQLPMPKAGTMGSTELRCVDCHHPDQSGAYFEPIRFEKHCHQCHQLGFPATGSLPHVSPEIIHGILLDRLAKNSESPIPPPVDPLGGPTKRPIDDANSTTDLGKRLQDQLDQLEQRLFGSHAEIPERPRPAGLLEAACTKCHYTEKSPDAKISWKVLPPDLPEKWMNHSRFRHNSHASVECALCHTRSGIPSDSVNRGDFYQKSNTDLQNSSSIFASRSATDILMPRIDVCRACHGAKSTSISTVTDHCADCHNYHHVPSSASMPSGIRDLLNSTSHVQLKSIGPSGEPNR